MPKSKNFYTLYCMDGDEYPFNLYFALLRTKEGFRTINEARKYIIKNFSIYEKSTDIILQLITSNIRCCERVRKTCIDIFYNGKNFRSACALNDITVMELYSAIDKMSDNLQQIISGFKSESINVSGLSDESDIVVLTLDHYTSNILRNNGISTLGDIKKNIETIRDLKGIGNTRLNRLRYHPKLIALYGDDFMNKMHYNKYNTESLYTKFKHKIGE